MTIPALQLLKDQERRLLAGHLWVYSNEVDTQATPLRGLEPGQLVSILDRRGRWLGYAHANPHSLICARLVSRARARPPGPALWQERLRIALELRERLYAEPFYRLVFGEGDLLPGLVVDRYDELLAVQLTTAGMERERAVILSALEELIRPRTIVLRNDIAVRELEGLQTGVETILGAAPDTLSLHERGMRFLVSPLTGQKTGWFYDQSENRSRLPRFGIRGRVLDVFSYTGAWGVSAAAQGADRVLCVDSSAAALERLTENAALNGVTDRVQTRLGDAFEALRRLRDGGERFDLVILDPPAFIKRRKDIREGVLAYRRLNQLGLEVLEAGGLLVTSSCSFHLDRDTFLGAVQQAARRIPRTLQLLEAGQQGPDHPAHPAIAETAYLKTFVLRAPADD